MDERLVRTVAKARALLEARAPDLVEKTMWGSPAGKKRLAKRLVGMFPVHKAYTEPFAGSGAVFFAKDAVPTEALNDADPDIANAYRYIQNLSEAEIQKLRGMDWRGSAETWKRIKEARPDTDLAKLHRFLYLSHFAYGNMRGKSFDASSAGHTSTGPDRVAKFAPRLKGVHISSGDYEPVVRKFDGPDTLHFLDPPYSGYNAAVGEGKFDEQRFFNVAKSLKGKFLITYGVRGKLPKLLKAEGYPIKRIRTPRTLRTMAGVGGSKFLSQIIASNYELSKKRLDEFALDGWELFEGEPDAEETGTTTVSVPAALEAIDATEADVETATEDAGDSNVPAAASGEEFAKTIPIIKGANPEDERFVLGIVLEPETVDAQNDIYSAAEIRTAAHRFMEEFQDVGLMHQMRVNGEVKIVESYLAPSDLTIAGTQVKSGTWLLGVHVLSDALWEDVKNGTLSGFSIGGSARRVEADSAPKETS